MSQYRHARERNKTGQSRIWSSSHHDNKKWNKPHKIEQEDQIIDSASHAPFLPFPFLSDGWKIRRIPSLLSLSHYCVETPPFSTTCPDHARTFHQSIKLIPFLSCKQLPSVPLILLLAYVLTQGHLDPVSQSLSSFLSAARGFQTNIDRAPDAKPSSSLARHVTSSRLSKACENVGDDGWKKGTKREREKERISRDVWLYNFPSNQRKGGMRWRGCCIGIHSVGFFFLPWFFAAE